MTIQEVARRYSELAQQNKWTEIVDTFYHDDIECIEPPNSNNPPFTKGKANVIAKAQHFEAAIEKVYSGYATEPIIAGNMFAVGIGMDLELKGAGRVRFDEFGVFTVKDGMIIREQFVMEWPEGGGHE